MTKELLQKTAELEKKSHLDYFKIAVTVDCVIFGYEERQLKVLVIKSDLKEYQGRYSLLGDFIKPDEDIDKASYRILKERTGLTNVYLEQVHTFGKVKRHPSGRVITTAYFSLVDMQSVTLTLSNNYLGWLPIHELRTMAFDHSIILKDCLKRLQDVAFEKPIIFNLLAKSFSMRELQDAYEAVLQCELDRRNFRKKMALKNWIVDINQIEKDVPHRPGRLFSLRNGL